MWTKPAATEMRFGFEVTMYVCNRQSLVQLKVKCKGTRKRPFAFHGTDYVNCYSDLDKPKTKHADDDCTLVQQGGLTAFLGLSYLTNTKHSDFISLIASAIQSTASSLA